MFEHVYIDDFMSNQEKNTISTCFTSKTFVLRWNLANQKLDSYDKRVISNKIVF